jgi:ribosomal protein L12E/L44/L45/RPP1/RPP2
VTDAVQTAERTEPFPTSPPPAKRAKPAAKDAAAVQEKAHEDGLRWAEVDAEPMREDDGSEEDDDDRGGSMIPDDDGRHDPRDGRRRGG